MSDLTKDEKKAAEGVGMLFACGHPIIASLLLGALVLAAVEADRRRKLRLGLAKAKKVGGKK